MNSDLDLLQVLWDGGPHSYPELAELGMNVHETVTALRARGYVIHEWRDRPLHWRQLGTVRYRLDQGATGEPSAPDTVAALSSRAAAAAPECEALASPAVQLSFEDA